MKVYIIGSNTFLRLSNLLALCCKTVLGVWNRLKVIWRRRRLKQTTDRHDLQIAFDPGSVNSVKPNFVFYPNEPEIDDISADGSREMSKTKKKREKLWMQDV